MRKTIVVFFCIVIAMTSTKSMAQGGIAGTGVTVEYTASPFGSSSFMSPGYFRVKYLTGQIGIRLGAMGSIMNTQLEPSTIEHVGFFDIRPGFEFHTGLGKASSYAGIEIIFMNQSANLNSTTEIGVANATDRFGSNRAFMAVGGALVAGVDYYVGEQFYIGFEVGLDSYVKFNKDVEMAQQVIIDATTDFVGLINMSNTFKMGFNF